MVKYADRILVHLLGNQFSMDEYSVPFSLTQPGIAEGIGTDIYYTNKLIKDLIDSDLLISKKKKVIGQKRKRKVYFLTSEGLKKAKTLQEELLDREIEVKLEDEIKEIKIGDLGEFVDCESQILYALRNKDDQDILDLTGSGERNEDIFVDREEEFEKLEEILNEDNTSLVSIKGEAGIGKTRLVKEFKRKAVSEGFEFISGRAYLEDDMPYLPIRNALADYSEDEDILWLSDEVSDNGIEEDERKLSKRDSAFKDIVKEIKQIASDRPLIVFLDDLHWSGKSTVQLLHYVIDQLDDAPILFVISYRPEEVNDGHPLVDTLNEMYRKGIGKGIELERLGWEDTKEMLEAFLGKRDIPEEFIKLVLDQFEGNPFFIKEGIRHMEDEGLIDFQKNSFPKSRKEISTPDIIKDVIRRRVNDLEHKTKRILKMGSVIGERVDFELLVEIIDYDRFDLLDRIDFLVDLSIWEENPSDDTFIFTHNLIQKVVYEDISTPVRKETHRLIAEKIKELHEKDLETSTKVARHYLKAEELEEAYNWYEKAGSQAEEVYAYEDAVEMYEKALSISDNASDEELIKLLIKIGDNKKTLGKYDEAREEYNKVLSKTDDKKILQKVNRKISETWKSQGIYDKVLHFADVALSYDVQEKKEKCKILEYKGWALMEKGDYDEAIEVFEEERDLAENLGEEKERAQALHDLGSIYTQKGDFDKAEEHLQSAIEIREEIGNLEGLSKSYNNIGNTYKRKGELDRALEYYERGLDIAEEIGDKRGIAIFLGNLAVIYQDKGELDRAMEYHERSLEIQEEIGDKHSRAMSLNNIGMIYRDKGELDRALEYYERSLDIDKEIGNKRGIADSLDNIGLIYQEKGELKRAMEYHEEGLSIRKEIGNKLWIVWSLCSLIETHLKKGDIEEAEEEAERALQIATDIGSRDGEGYGHRVLGMVYREQERWSDAEDEFERGINILEEIGRKDELSKTHYEYGLMLKSMGEQEKAKEHIEKALSMFEDMGMELWVDKTKEELDDIKVKSSKASS